MRLIVPSLLEGVLIKGKYIGCLLKLLNLYLLIYGVVSSVPQTLPIPLFKATLAAVLGARLKTKVGYKPSTSAISSTAAFHT